MEQTIGFSDKGNRWTSFYGFEPDMMVGCNNTFYSFKDGELYEHDLGEQNTFYGVFSPSVIETIFNQEPHVDKTFNNIYTESTDPWELVLESNLTTSTIDSTEFNLRESRWFAYTRRNEEMIDFKSLATVGIGNAQADSGTTLTFQKVNERVSVGDILYQSNGALPEMIGTVTAITPTTITVDAYAVPVSVTNFFFTVKDSRTEGSRMRGYFLKATLTNRETRETEIFAVNSNAHKSYV